VQRGIVGVVVGLAVAVAVAGCGGDDSLTKAEFVEQGNEICRVQVKEKNDFLEAAFKDPKQMKPSNRDKLLEETLVPLRKMVTELEALESPEEAAKAAEAVVSELDEVLKEVEKDPSIALGKDPFSKARGEATKYGLSECAQL
jgi:hypothetical protein